MTGLTVRRGNRLIFGQWTYHLTYDPESGKFSCSCASFLTRQDCRHVYAFKRELTRLKHLKDGNKV